MTEDHEYELVFFDTEFTHLFNVNSIKGPELISVGLIGESGKLFYAENAEFDESECTTFVLDEVLPHLQGGEYLMQYEDLAKRLKSWIESFGKPVLLVSDAPNFDWPYLSEMFVAYSYPNNLVKYGADEITFDNQAQLLRFKLHLKEIEKGVDFKKHHALEDAKANRDAFAFATQ